MEDVEATGTLARHLLSTIASSHYALTIRFLRAVQLLEDSRAEAAIRNLERHHLLAHIDETKKAVATEAGISSELVLLQVSFCFSLTF